MAIYILPEFQGQGIGSKLLSDGIEGLKGIKRLFVSVEKENAIGSRFYEAKGFVAVNESEEQFQGHTLRLVKIVLKFTGDEELD